MANAQRVDAADDLLDELVHQFSDRFAFYRELVQNSIDAGSTRIDIVLRYLPDTAGGTATAEISDWGEGMNRQVIEDYLLTKFRSSKENDLTKIGKFGIGFVSVFAPEPEFVVVETGRDGEAWRILFKEDRSYDLFKSAEAVEGTRVTLHKRMTANEYDVFRQKSLEALKSWCRHSEAEVTFAAGTASGDPPDEPITIGEPFVVDAPYQVEYEEEGTRIVAGPSRVDPPYSGLYNRGLTLLETREPLVPGVTFKLLSRYLEHTLTRDNVLRDEHFERAMALVRKVAEGALLDRLPAELKAAIDRGDWSDYSVLLRFARDRELPHARLVFPVANGGGATGDELRRAKAALDALPCATQRTVLVERMAEARLPTLRADPNGALAELVKEVLAIDYAAEASALCAVADPVEGDERADALALAVTPLLEAADARSRGALVATLHGAGADLPWITVDAPKAPTPEKEARRSPFVRGAGRWLCLNRGHARIAQALEIARTSPAVAGALVLRLVAASGKPLGEAEDTELTLAALRS